VVDGQRVSLAELEDQPVTSVSQIELTGSALASLARGLHEAAEGFMTNARRSEEAPVDEDVLRHLHGVMSGAETASRAALAFLEAFHERYDGDIREARQGERMNNAALTG
jgi:hypothetical protein